MDAKPLKAGHFQLKDSGLAMSLIIWTKNFSVGNPALDSDHKILMSLINHIHDAKKAGEDETAVASLLETLMDYAQQHFSREEGLMKKNNYPDLDRHREEHKMLTDQLSDLLADYHKTGSHETSDEIIEILRFWLVEHILEVDMDYKPFMSGERPANA